MVSHHNNNRRVSPLGEQLSHDLSMSWTGKVMSNLSSIQWIIASTSMGSLVESCPTPRFGDDDVCSGLEQRLDNLKVTWDWKSDIFT